MMKLRLMFITIVLLLVPVKVVSCTNTIQATTDAKVAETEVDTPNTTCKLYDLHLVADNIYLLEIHSFDARIIPIHTTMNWFPDGYYTLSCNKSLIAAINELSTQKNEIVVDVIPIAELSYSGGTRPEGAISSSFIIKVSGENKYGRQTPSETEATA